MSGNNHRITVQSLGRTVSVLPSDTILEALIEHQVEYPHGCTTGLCGLCKSRLISGRIDLLDHYESALSPLEREAGLMLPCCAIPQADCVITPVQHDALLSHVNSFDAEIAGMRELTHDIRLVQLRASGDVNYDFLPGQYASLAFADLPPRDFSMASCPGDPTLDFFIRRISQGAVTEFVFENARIGDRVRVKGPYGTAYLREGHLGPIIAVAGGSGLAPIRSIIATALDRGMNQEIRAYLGVRSEQDVYMEDEFALLASRHPNLAVEIALSESEGSVPYRSGRLDDIIAQDFSGRNLSEWRAYVAGPPVMVDAVSAQLKELELPDDRCHTDPFLTAADHRSRSHTSVR